MAEDFNISLLQFDIVWEDPLTNYQQIESLILNSSFTPDIIVLPEMFNTGFTMEPAKIASENSNRLVIERMKKWAEATAAAIIGSVAWYEADKYYNRLLAVTPAGDVFHYDKRHLFRMGAEQAVYTAGNERVVFEFKGWRIALFVCYDLRFPVWSRNRRDYDLAVYVANWPDKRIDAWKALLKARAIENQCYVAGVNRVGKDKYENYNGATRLIDFYGTVIEKAPDGTNCLTNGSLLLKPLQRFRERFPAWMDADSFIIE